MSDQPIAFTGRQRAADIVAAILLVVALWWAIVGQPAVFVGRVPILPAPLLLIYIAGCVQIARHLLWPRPSVLVWFKHAHAALRARPNLEAAVSAFVATRPAVFAMALAAVVAFGLAGRPQFVLSREPLANLPARYDAGWYAGIATEGYSWDHTFRLQRNIAFFPALPLLMRPVGFVFGMYDQSASPERRALRALWAGVVISLAAFFWALYYVTRLAADLIGRERAAGASMLLAAYPFALFYNAPYTESLFLLGAVAACHHFRRCEWLAASFWGLLVGLTRPNGCFVSIPLAIIGFEQLYRAQTARGPGTLRTDARAVAVLYADRRHARHRDADLHGVSVSPDRRLVRMGAQPRGVGEDVSGPRALRRVRRTHTR